MNAIREILVKNGENNISNEIIDKIIKEKSVIEAEECYEGHNKSL